MPRCDTVIMFVAAYGADALDALVAGVATRLRPLSARSGSKLADHKAPLVISRQLTTVGITVSFGALTLHLTGALMAIR